MAGGLRVQDETKKPGKSDMIRSRMDSPDRVIRGGLSTSWCRLLLSKKLKTLIPVSVFGDEVSP